VGIARGTGAKLELVTVDAMVPTLSVSTRADGEHSVWASAMADRATEYLEAVAEQIGSEAGVTVGRAVRTGTKVAELLLEHAADVGAELIVMATHGYGPLKRAWLGSVADAVTRHTPVPIVLIRPAADGASRLTPESLFRHVLIPLDGSPTAEEVLPHAIAVGQLANARYTLLQVVLPPFVGTPMESFPPDMTERLLRENREAAESYLDRVATQLRERQLQVETMVPVEPFTADAILDRAEGGSADLIALTTHGRGGLGRLMMGSVADKVVRGAGVPVLLCRAAGA
jgi:nucleotide-binding universal stress UspA family protein